MYAAQYALQTDPSFTSRVVACVNKETLAWEVPPTSSTAQIVAAIMPAVAAAPGLADAYLWGDQAMSVVPGHGAISDAQVLATVQPLLEAYRPEEPG